MNQTETGMEIASSNSGSSNSSGKLSTSSSTQEKCNYEEDPRLDDSSILYHRFNGHADSRLES